MSDSDIKSKKIKDYLWIVLAIIVLAGFPVYRYFQTLAENPAFQVETEDTKKVEECIENYGKTGNTVLGIHAFTCTIQVAATIYPTDSKRAMNLCLARYIPPIKTDVDKTYAEGQCKMQIEAKITDENVF